MMHSPYWLYVSTPISVHRVPAACFADAWVIAQVAVALGASRVTISALNLGTIWSTEDKTG